MTRDEYLAVLATEPATDTQVGAIIAEFDRLGVVDRAERLTISAALLDLENLGSTADLVMGQAGRLVAMLRRIRDRGELPDLAAPVVDEDQADESGDEQDENDLITWPEAIARLLVMIYISARKHQRDELADIGPNFEQLRARGLFSPRPMILRLRTSWASE